MTQSAGIQLQVGLDLAFFRQQLTTLGATAAGYKLPINVQFDRRSVQNELNALGRNISQRIYRLEVKTNLGMEIDNAKKLADALARLQQVAQGAKGVFPVGTKALGLKKGPGQPGANEIKSLYEALAMAGTEGFEQGSKKNRAQMVAQIGSVAKDTVAGLLNGLKSQDARVQAAAKSLGASLIASMKAVLGIASPSKEFEKIGKNVGEGFEKGALSSMDKAFDALERQLQERLRKLQGMMQPSASRRGAFPFVAKTGAIESQALISESVALAQQLDQARAQIAQIQQRREGRLSFERASLSESAGRMLPASRSAVPMVSAQELVAKSFYVNMQNGSRMLRENFSANSYFPEATKALASAMDDATSGIKALPGARGPIAALPSTEMLDRRKFQSAMEKAAQIDAQNITLQQTARANATMQMRQQLSALPPLSAPSIGNTNAPLSRAATYSLNKANQLLGLPIGPSSPLGSMGQFPMSGIAGRGSMGQFPVDPMLAVGGASAMGQKTAGPYPFSNTARSARGGYFPGISSSLFFPMSGMMGPSSPLGTITPQSSMFGAGGPPSGPPRPPSGGGGMGGLGGFGRALGGVNLPGAGVVREIGEEFGMATKQVLLFGTAYKALAFATSFPAQVGQAVSALQSFNNTLKAISPSAEEARASNQFILDIVDRYNVPLQSARDGFTKLYASMAPAGFKGDEIRALFTGVSQAAATFGMSADKVDRVNYAFAQMASKGQVMSEELKGQLGDVLPGAMGIFAKAAGFEGADAIQKFGKALEDGAYKGKPMRDLLKNVTIELQKEFGPGAEGAARTYQGAMNRMANSTKLLYESFEPVAINFLNSIVVPITNGLKTVTDGFNAFFTGTQAKTAGGSAFAKQLESLRPTFQGIAANIQQILPLLQNFANTALALGQILLQIAGNPFVGYLARIYLSVLPVTMALRILNLQALIPLIGSFMRAIPAFIAFQVAMIRGIGTNRALIATMQLTGQTAGITAGRVRLVSAALATLGTAAILGGIGLLIEKFLMMKSAIDGVKQSTQQMLVSISGMANSGAVKELENFSKNIQKQKSTFTELKQFVSGGLFGGGTKELTQEMAKKFKEVGMGSFVSKNLFGKPIITDFLKAAEIIDAKLQGLNKESASVGEKLPMARRIAADIAQQAQTAETATTAIDLPGNDGAGDKPKTQSLESYHSLQDQLAKNFTQDQLDRMEQEYQSKVDRINAEFNLREARANSYQKEAIRFEKQMSDIELKRQKALLDASAEVIKAQGSVAGGAGGQSATGATGLLQGSTGISSGAHFDVRRQDGSYISPDQAKALFDPSVRRQLAMTSAYGPRRAPVPGASTFHKGVDLAGPANTPLNLAPGFAMTGSGEKGGLGYAASVRGPSGEMYDVGHLQRPKAGMGTPRKVTGDEKRDVIADQKAQLAIAQKSLAVQIAEAQAVRDAAVAWAEYTTSIAPIEEQKLQNSILAKKNDLVKLGMPDDVIEREMKHFETQQKTALAVEVVEKMLADKKISAEAATAKIAELNKRMADYNKLLGDNIELQRQQKFDANFKQLRDQIEALRVIGDEERRLFELRKEYGDDKKAQEIFDLEKIKENIEDTRALIDGFVSQTSSDYKGFLKAVISGEDAVDALKQFQEGLKDRVLTIFLDFAMAPVEKFMKESLEGLFLPGGTKGLKPEEEQAKTGVEGNTVATNENTTAIKNLTAVINGEGAASPASTVPGGEAGGGIFDAANVFSGGGNLTGGIFDTIAQQMGGATESFDRFSAHMGKFVDSSVASADAVGSWGDSFNTQLSNSLTKATDTSDKQGFNFQESLGKAVGAIGIAAGSIMGIAAGISQIKEGGTANVLGGIGSILTSVGGGMMGFMGMFGANGGVAPKGWQPFPVAAFANGGMVTGPTLGLVGEGKYNEAIVPLPDGRSIPVQFNQQSSLREAMAGGNNNTSSPSVLSMTFESSNINGVEYVSRDQLEQAMAQTRRQASRDGAQRGMTMTLDKLQQSPSTRSRIGMR